MHVTQKFIRRATTLSGRSMSTDAVAPSLIRNVAIVAHVDHGKTTLVDGLLQSASESTGGTKKGERLMDSGDLEKERGITIMSKVTRVGWSDGHVINITDTPGHADFGGEVERIMSMVDGVVLVVDATEGAKAQTKFVLSKALDAGLSPLLVLNKADRPTSRLDGEVESDIFDLFASLGANDDQLDYPTYYASAVAGWVTDDVEEAAKWSKGETIPDYVEKRGLSPLLDAFVEHVIPPMSNDDPANSKDAPFSMAMNSVAKDQFIGRIATGRIHSGFIKADDLCDVLERGATVSDDPDIVTIPSKFPSMKVQGVFTNRGLERVPLETSAGPGDIVTLAGVDCDVGDTITMSDVSFRVDTPIDTPPLAPPTLSMTVGPNTSPMQGQEGTIVTASKIKDRLLKETDNNVTITVKVDGERCEVFGRGELQLGILFEEMRREGYEMTVSPPKILLNDSGMEPVEEVYVDVDTEHVGTIINMLTGNRKGSLIDTKEDLESDRASLLFHVPTRGLLGFNSEAASATRGSAVVNHLFLEMQPHMGPLGDGLSPGKLVSTDLGKATSYALNMVQDRGILFVENNDMVYPGMVVGEHSRAGDLDVNPNKAKAVNNIRATKGADDKMVINAPVRRTLEELIAYMGQDEQLEVTPKSVRLRKTELDPKLRQRAMRDLKRAKAGSGR
jgi:GTP-binding protein